MARLLDSAQEEGSRYAAEKARALAEIDEGRRMKDRDRIARAAHLLRPSAAQCQDPRLAATLLNLEEWACSQARWAEAEPLWGRLARHA